MKSNTKTLFLCSVLSWPLCGMAQEGPPAPTVVVSPALAEQTAAQALVPGTVISRHDADLAAELSGKVEWVAEVGDRFTAGEVVARIDRRSLEYDLRRNKAQGRRLQTQLEYQNSRLQRMVSLAKENNAARNDLDEARSQANILVHDIEANDVSREQIEYRLAQTEIRAPNDGQVVSREVQLGEYVTAGQAVVRLVDTVNKEIQSNVPVKFTPWLQPGSLVEIAHEDQRSRSRLRAVIPVGDPLSRMIEIRVEVDRPEWVIGSAVRVAIPTSDERRVVAVPRDSLVLRGNEIFVYRVAEDSTVERLEVKTGAGLGSYVEAIGDVQVGDSLVIRGAERLQPGQAVSIVSATTS